MSAVKVYPCGSCGADVVESGSIGMKPGTSILKVGTKFAVSCSPAHAAAAIAKGSTSLPEPKVGYECDGCGKVSTSLPESRLGYSQFHVCSEACLPKALEAIKKIQGEPAPAAAAK